jgi:uncharacterized protein YdaU (DUF1376 family)
VKYFRHFPGDYLRDTLHLTLIEDGIYRRLLDWQYLHEEPIRDFKHATQITRMTRCTMSKKCKKIVEKFFQLHADGWWNPRFLKEQAHYYGISYKRREAAFAKHLHKNSAHNPDTRKKEKTPNIELSQDHPPVDSVENGKKPLPVREEKNLSLDELELRIMSLPTVPLTPEEERKKKEIHEWRERQKQTLMERGLWK